MRRLGRRGASAAKRCPECGVPVKEGLKYCDFCGTKLEDAVAVSGPAQKQARGTARRIFVGIVAAGLAAGILAYLGKNLGEQKTAPAPAPTSLDGRGQAAAACETAIRDLVRAPFRVIAFRSALVAEAQGGYTVSGSVELQSTLGEVRRKRYFCRLHPDARAGMVLDEGRME